MYITTQDAINGTYGLRYKGKISSEYTVYDLWENDIPGIYDAYNAVRFPDGNVISIQGPIHITLAYISYEYGSPAHRFSLYVHSDVANFGPLCGMYLGGAYAIYYNGSSEKAGEPPWVINNYHSECMAAFDNEPTAWTAGLNGYAEITCYADINDCHACNHIRNFFNYATEFQGTDMFCLDKFVDGWLLNAPSFDSNICGDFNSNGTANLFDYELMGQNRTQEAPDKSLDDDNDVDIYDLKIFCDYWLEE